MEILEGMATRHPASEALTVSGGSSGGSGQVAGVCAELAALTRDVPRFRLFPRASGTGADVLYRTARPWRRGLG
jgi:hypothetical protein